MNKDLQWESKKGLFAPYQMLTALKGEGKMTGDYRYQYASRRWFDYRETSLYSYNHYDNRHMVNESSIYVINNN